MNAKIYLPYINYGDDLFSMNNDYYSDSNSYIDAMTDDYNRNKDIVTNSVLDMMEGHGNLYSGTDGNTYSFGQSTQQAEEKYSYAKCDCTIFNEEGEDESVDSIISNMVRQQPVVYMVELDRDTSEEEFEEELRAWSNDHNGINQYKVFKGEEWGWMNEPVRNLKVSFQNKKGDTIYMMLNGCRILDIVDGTSYILYIDKMEMFNN